MPAFNAMPFLKEAVESICAQAFEDFEFVIIDDGSTDETTLYLGSLKDQRIRVIRQKNQGPSVGFNRALRECSSEFVARMDADDVALPERFGLQIEFLEANPAVGLVGSQYRPIGTKRTGRSSQLPIVHEHIHASLMNGNHAICNPTVMCRRVLLQEVGGYQPDGVLEDWAMFLNMGEVARLANIDRPLLHYRIHSASTNTRHMAELRSRIAYACDRARRRNTGMPPLDYSDFLDLRASASWLARFRGMVGDRAMLLYRSAQADILGGREFRGYLSLAIAASLAPTKSLARIVRGPLKHYYSGKLPDQSPVRRLHDNGHT